MSVLKRVFVRILRIVCYLALVIVLAGIVSLIWPFATDHCSNQSGATVSCTSTLYQTMYEFGFTVVMMAIFTGLPALLALGGVVFLVKDISSWFGGGKTVPAGDNS